MILKKSANITFIEKNSLNLIFEKKKYDLIWVDGAHGNPVVTSDILNSLRLLNKKGVMACDDIYIEKNTEDFNYNSFSPKFADQMYSNMNSYETLTCLEAAKLIKFKLIYKRVDTNNKIPIGNDVMHIEFNHLRENRSSYDPVLRGSFLYNLVDESFVWDKNFDNVRVIFLIPFEDAIEQARRFITIRASRIFHDRTLGANALHRFSQQDELRALSFLKQAEASTADHNIFNSLDQFKTVSRNMFLK